MWNARLPCIMKDQIQGSGYVTTQSILAERGKRKEILWMARNNIYGLAIVSDDGMQRLRGKERIPGVHVTESAEFTP